MIRILQKDKGDTKKPQKKEQYSDAVWGSDSNDHVCTIMRLCQKDRGSSLLSELRVCTCPL